MTPGPDSPRHATGLAGATAAIVFACALAVLAATPEDSFWIADCGAKALMAERLLDSGFTSIAIAHPAPALDPTGAAFPIPAPFAVRHGDAWVTQYPPAYPALAAPFLAGWGPVGLRIPAALGLAACAFCFAMWTAPALGRARAVTGGAVLALATPLFFYGVTVWEHTLTVALVLAAVCAAARRSAVRLVAAGALLGLAGWLREELLLALPALALASWLRDRSVRDLLAIGAGAAPVVLALAAFNAAVYGSPAGVHVGVNLHALPGLAASLHTAASLLGGQGTGALENAGLALAALLAIGLTAFGAASERWRTPAFAAAAVLALGVWARGTLGIAGADVPYLALARWNGLAVHVPLLCFAGAGAVQLRRVPALAPLRLGVATGLFFLLFFLPFRATVSDPALGGHWGPRMLLPALPALLALALAAWPTARLARGLFVACAAAALLSTALSVRLLDAQKREIASLQRAIAARSEHVRVTTHPALGPQLTALWGQRPLLLARDEASLNRVAADVARAGVEEFLLIWRPDPRYGPPRIAATRCTPSGRHTGAHVERIFDVAFYACDAPHTASSPPSARPID